MLTGYYNKRRGWLLLTAIFTLALAGPVVAQTTQENTSRLKVLEGYVTRQLTRMEADLQTPAPQPTTRDLSHAALAYIIRGQDYEKARKALEHLFALQDMNPASPGYGTVPWQENNPEIKDPNAIEFTAMGFAPIFIRYSSAFPADFIATATKHLQASIAAIRRHKVPPSYTNISLMRAANLILLGEYLHDAEASKEGEAVLDQWLAFTRENGLSEFGSSVYGGVQSNVVASLKNNVREPRIQAKAKMILDYMWTDFAANYFVAGDELSGASSRTYSFLKHDYNLNGAFYVLGFQNNPPPAVGVLSEDVLTWANGNWGKYRPDAKIYELSRVPERIVCQRWGLKPGQDRYNYITPEFALGSSSCYYQPQDREIALHLASPKKLPIITVIPDNLDAPYGKLRLVEGGGHRKIQHIRYALSAVQEKGAVLALLDLTPGVADSLKSKYPVNSIGTNVILPYQADGLFVDGKEVEWTGGDIPVSAQSTIGVLEGKTGVAIRLFRADNLAEGKSTTFFLKADGKDFKDFPAVRLVAYHAASKGEIIPVSKALSGVLILVSPCKDREAFQNFLVQAKQWALTEKTEGDLWQVTATPPKSTATAPVLSASLNLVTKMTGPRLVNGKEIVPSLMTINGVDWSTEVWKVTNN